MDPFTAALIISSIGVGMIQSSKAKDEQKRAQRAQEQAQRIQQQNELGAASQSLSMALGQARQRPTGTQGGGVKATSFNAPLGVSALGGLQTQSAGSLTSGTF